MHQGHSLQRTFQQIFQRPDFADTLMQRRRGRVITAPVDIDPLEQMAQHDRADWALLRLVCCASLATMVLALASSLRGG